MFNIYYLNYSKAFEIAMLKDNEIIESKEERTSQNKQDGSTMYMAIGNCVKRQLILYATCHHYLLMN